MFRLKNNIYAEVRKLRNITEEELQRAMEALAYIGERTVNEARTDGNYTDRTGNLRHSVGYEIEDTRTGQGNLFLPGASSKAQTEAEEARKEAKKVYGINLLLFAGMRYAEFVEAKGYTVLTDYVPSQSEIETFLKRSLKK